MVGPGVASCDAVCHDAIPEQVDQEGRSMHFIHNLSREHVRVRGSSAEMGGCARVRDVLGLEGALWVRRAAQLQGALQGHEFVSRPVLGAWACEGRHHVGVSALEVLRCTKDIVHFWGARKQAKDLQHSRGHLASTSLKLACERRARNGQRRPPREAWKIL